MIPMYVRIEPNKISRQKYTLLDLTAFSSLHKMVRLPNISETLIHTQARLRMPFSELVITLISVSVWEWTGTRQGK